jgi:hypothetical protein
VLTGNCSSSNPSLRACCRAAARDVSTLSSRYGPRGIAFAVFLRRKGSYRRSDLVDAYNSQARWMSTDS